VVVCAIAKQMADNSTNIDFVLMSSVPGFIIIKMPIKPKIILPVFRRVVLSFKKMAARIKIQIGVVNSIAVTSASDK